MSTFVLCNKHSKSLDKFEQFKQIFTGDYYMTITESKRDFNEDGTPYYKKHKIYLYKEDFINFKDNLEEVTNYIFEQKGEDIITSDEKKSEKTSEQSSSSDFTEVNLDEIDSTKDS